MLKKIKVTWQYVNTLEVELSYYRLKNKNKYASKITDKLKKRHNHNHKDK